MIEITFQQALVLKNVVSAIKDLSPKVMIDIDDRGLHLQAMDTSSVALISLELDDTDGFSSYRCDKSTSIGLDLTIFDKILKLADSREKLTLELSGDADSFFVQIRRIGY